MPISPGYGETPLDFEELDALLLNVRRVLDSPITKAEIFDLEQAIHEDVAEELIGAAFEDSLTVEEILTDHFIRELHWRLYGDIWSWAGIYRQRMLSIGIFPESISTELRAAVGTIRYRWEHTDDWSPHQLGVAVHAETVRIHPFTDGNGRSTRLLADLTFAAAQNSDNAEEYDWQVDRKTYIKLLREYDRHRDPAELAHFIPVRRLSD